MGALHFSAERKKCNYVIFFQCVLCSKALFFRLQCAALLCFAGCSDAMFSTVQCCYVLQCAVCSVQKCSDASGGEPSMHGEHCPGCIIPQSLLTTSSICLIFFIMPKYKNKQINCRYTLQRALPWLHNTPTLTYSPPPLPFIINCNSQQIMQRHFFPFDSAIW